MAVKPYAWIGRYERKRWRRASSGNTWKGGSTTTTSEWEWGEATEEGGGGGRGEGAEGGGVNPVSGEYTFAGGLPATTNWRVARAGREKDLTSFWEETSV